MGEPETDVVSDLAGKLRGLLDTAVLLAGVPGLDRLAGEVLAAYARLTEARGGSFYVRQDLTLSLLGCLDPGHAPQSIGLPLGAGSVLQEAESSRKPLLIHAFSGRGSGWEGYKDGSALVFPLVDSRDGVSGFVSLHNRRSAPFTAADLELGQVLAALAAQAIASHRTGAALRDSELRYREVFDHSSSGIVLFDVTPDLRFSIVSANPAVERMTGLPGAVVTGKFIEEVLPAEIAQRLSSFYRTCVQSGEPLSVDQSIDFPAGRRTFHTMLIPVKDGQGRVHRLIALPIDMTDRTRAETALRQSEEKFSKAFHASPDSIAISRLSDGTFIDVNRGFTEINGYSREEVVGRSSMPDDLEIWVHAPERAAWTRILEEKGEVTAFEAASRRKDGSVGWVLLSARIIEIDGEKCVLTIARDVTDRKRMEEALRDSEARYREIFENTSDGIFVVEVTLDQRFRLLSYNPAQERMLGISSMNAVGKFSDEYLPADFAARINEDNRRCIEAGRPMSFEEALDLPGGRTHYYTTLVPVRDHTGRIARLIGVTRDMTERKLSEERERAHELQLFQAAKLASLGTLVSGIAHEINNPNNFIRLNSQSLKELWRDIRTILDQAAEKDGDLALHGIPLQTAQGMVEDLLGGIEEGSKRIEKLLLNLRDFARGDEGDLTETVDVNEVIGSAVMIAANLIRKSTDSFTVLETAGLPCVRGNYHQIEQVLINLITNACQSLPARDRSVTVRTGVEEGGAWVLMDVEDEGTGIPAQNIPQVTDPFFTTKRAQGGSGLGLAVSSRIVTNHGGTMSFNSQVGKGTRVTVRLPVAGSPQ